ncbi:thiol reductant ABC exporter subunit CydC [Streptomyces sp. 2A115]|uniref:thiol reductant ABC exporter subunit CydC n=1 Tax=Streptomyces sp. 2A115 TaxID=3457439 RepID=UPI003FD5ED09
MMSPVLVALRAAAPRPGRLAAATAVALTADFAAVALMAIAAWLLATAAGMPSYEVLAVAIVAVRALAVGRGGLRYVERLLSHDVTLRAQGELRVRVYQAVAGTRPKAGQGPREADLLSRMVADVDLVQDLLLRCLVPAVVAVGAGTAGVLFLWAFVPVAGLVLLAGLILVAVAVPALTVLMARLSARATAELRADLAVRGHDLIEGAAELAMAGQAARAVADTTGAAAVLGRAERRWGDAVGTGIAVATAVQILTAGLVGWVALAESDTAGGVDGVMVPVLALTALAVTESAAALVDAALRFVEARQAARRVADVLRAPRAAEPARRPLPESTPRLALSGVTVCYPGEDGAALDGVDLVVEPGRRIAVVGASGAGKSTLLGLLCGALPPTSGSVDVAGTDIADWAEPDLAAMVSGLPQDAHVFATTVADNLRIAVPDATDAELRVALARARLLDWADSLPKGLRTPVGADGAVLSGGQRQRLLLARAFLADPPVLLLDEPTEGLDEPTARAVLDDLLIESGPRTLVVVTHRTKGLTGFDEVVFLDAGRVVRRGGPDAVVGPGHVGACGPAE